MALPAADSPDDIPNTTCCNTLSLLADRIRTVAMDGLCGCLEESCADRTFRSYVTVGPAVQEPLGDALVVLLRSFGPTPGSETSRGMTLPVAVLDAQFEVHLLENGWPMVETNEMSQVITVPDSEMVNNITLHSMGHGEKMWRSLQDAVQRRALFLSADNPHIGMVRVSRLRPRQPSAYIVGWSCDVQVEVTL